jgi:hypothetical protein
MEVGTVGHNFGKGSPTDHSNNMHPLFFFLAHLRVRWTFVITLRRSSVRTQLLKIFSSETTWPLETKLWWGHQRTKQSLVPIGPVVSEMKIFWMSSPFFILSNSDHVGWRSGLSDTIFQVFNWGVLNSEKEPFHLLNIKKLLLKPWFFFRFYHG